MAKRAKGRKRGGGKKKKGGRAGISVPLSRYKTDKLKDISDDGVAVSGEKRAAVEKWRPGHYSASWDRRSNNVIPSVNTIESNFPRTVKVDGVTITPDGVVKGTLKRRRRRALTVCA